LIGWNDERGVSIGAIAVSVPGVGTDLGGVRQRASVCTSLTPAVSIIDRHCVMSAVGVLAHASFLVALTVGRWFRTGGLP
jgi:hypothetical protein